MMKNMIGWALLLCLATAGLIRVTAKEGESASTAKETAISVDAKMDAVHNIINGEYKKLEPIFARGCYDCHSAQTEFPWYHKLPLVGSWMDSHIEEAREHLDMTGGFPFKGAGSQAEMLEEIWEEIEKGDMPLLSYRLMHWDAAPDETEKDSIRVWVERSTKLLDGEASEQE